MNRLVEEFQTAALAAFKWLEEYSFKAVGRDHALDPKTGRPLYAGVTWSNSGLQMFVQVTLEYPRPTVIVEFGPLVDGAIPEPRDTANRYHLSALVAEKSGSYPDGIDVSRVDGISGSRLSSALVKTADALRSYGQQILRGDRDELAALEKFAADKRQRLRERYLSPGV